MASSPAWYRLRRTAPAAVALTAMLSLSACGGAASTDGPSKMVNAEATATPAETTSGGSTLSASPSPTEPTDAPGTGVPDHLLVPSMDIDAQVVPVSMDNQILYPPSNPSLVGWWNAGAKPGAAQGTAILVAHSVHTGGGVFDNLDNLGRGDSFTVGTAKGQLRYTVTRTMVFHKNELPRRAAKLFRQTGPGRVVLVSCDDWDGKVWESNVVVVGTLANGTPHSG